MFFEYSKNEAEYLFFIQVLSGCPTDKVRGLKKGFGEKSAINKLIGCDNKNLLSNVLALYIKEYGEHRGINEFYTQYNLLKILREKEDFIIPEFTEINKQYLIINQF